MQHSAFDPDLLRIMRKYRRTTIIQSHKDTKTQSSETKTRTPNKLLLYPREIMILFGFSFSFGFWRVAFSFLDVELGVAYGHGG